MARAVLVTTGLVAAAGGLAGAALASISGIAAPVSSPVNVCDITIAVLGSAQSGCSGGASVGGELPLPTSGPLSSPLRPAPAPKAKPKHHKPSHHSHHSCTTGSGSKSGGSTGSTTPVSPSSALGSLPITGMNVAGILASALGLLGAGVGAVVASRHRFARQEARIALR